MFPENPFDSLFFWIILAAVLGVVVKGAFWVMMFMGILKGFGGSAAHSQPVYNPWAAIFGIPQAPSENPQQRLARMRVENEARYAMRGLTIGLTAILLGVVLVFAGHGYGDAELSVAGFGLQRAGPGVVLMVLGVVIIKFTRDRKKK